MDTDRSKAPDHVKKGAELEYLRWNRETRTWYKMVVEVLTDAVWSDTAGPERTGDWVVQALEKYPPETRPAKVFENTWAQRLSEPEYIQTVTPGQKLRHRVRTYDGTLIFVDATAKSEIVNHKVLVTYQTRDGMNEREFPQYVLYTIEAAETMLQRARGRPSQPRGGYQPRRDPQPRRDSTGDDGRVARLEGYVADLLEKAGMDEDALILRGEKLPTSYKDGVAH